MYESGQCYGHVTQQRAMAEVGKRFAFSIYLKLAIFLLHLTSSLGLPGHPVILVPGDGGSQFMAKLNKTAGPHVYCTKVTSDYFSLWLNLEELAPFVLDCFVDNMRLVYDNKTHITLNSPGVDIKIPGFGNTSSVEWLDPSQLKQTSYFSPLVETLVAAGYVRGLSVRGAPYDFRKAPNELGEFFQNLKKLVEETFTINGNKKVMFVGHSMGNPTTLYFLNHQTQAWKDKYIRGFISLAGVWGGAVKPLRLMASGDSLGVIFVNPLSVRPEQRSMPSTAWLMPSNQFWNSNEILVVSPYRNYTVNDYAQFFSDIKYETGYFMRKDTAGLITDLTPPGVEVFCLHGKNISTPGQLKYTAKTWHDSQPIIVPDDGDGTVNIRSLLGCLRWQGKQPHAVNHQVFDNAEHMAILQNKDVINYVLKTLQGS